MTIMLQQRPAFTGTSKQTSALIEEALAQVQFTAFRKRRFGGLSGGERQRVLFAQALAPRPDLLVLDEATASMDEEGREMIEQLVRRLNDQGATVLWVNHDLDQVRRIADRVVLINRTCVFSGPPADLPGEVRDPNELSRVLASDNKGARR